MNNGILNRKMRDTNTDVFGHTENQKRKLRFSGISDLHLKEVFVSGFVTGLFAIFENSVVRVV